MENAVKALLIAAAVIIAVMLITLGVNLLNSGAEQIDNTDLSEYDIQQFNSKFEKYVGDRKSAAEVNAMLKTVFYHNNAQEDEGARIQVVDSSTANDGDQSIDLDDQADDAAVPTVTSGQKYDVDPTYNDGILRTLTITDPN